MVGSSSLDYPRSTRFNGREWVHKVSVAFRNKFGRASDPMEITLKKKENPMLQMQARKNGKNYKD